MGFPTNKSRLPRGVLSRPSIVLPIPLSTLNGPSTMTPMGTELNRPIEQGEYHTNSDTDTLVNEVKPTFNLAASHLICGTNLVSDSFYTTIEFRILITLAHILSSEEHNP